MALSALPPRLRKKEAWIKSDQNVWYKWWWLDFKLKWLTFGPNAEEWWARFRKVPKTLFVLHGKGQLRYERYNGTHFLSGDQYIMAGQPWDYYLSRIQPWVRWHIALQWPLLFQFSWIYKEKDVVSFPTYQSDFGIDKMVTGLIGFKRDPDVYWLTAFFGGNFE